MGKGIRREGVKRADFLNPVPIPQKTTFLVEVAWHEGFLFFVFFVLSDIPIIKGFDRDSIIII